MKRASVCSIVVAVLLVAVAAPARTAGFEVAAADAAPPGEVAAAVAGALAPGSLVVSASGETVAEFWLRSQPPLKDPPDELLEVAFGGLAEAELLGVVRVAREWKEYKGLAIEPGAYTLRYARRPADGNHMGVSMYRDFLLLVPADADTSVEVEWSRDELYARSMAATGTAHPATLALFPVWEPVDEPRVLENDMGQPMLAVPLGPLAVGLTVEGQGDH